MTEPLVIFVVATTGQGDPPTNMKVTQSVYCIYGLHIFKYFDVSIGLYDGVEGK